MKIFIFRAQFFQKYSTKTSILVGFFSNLLVILNYFIIAYFAFWPSQDFERLIWNCVEVTGINLNGAVFLGVSMKVLNLRHCPNDTMTITSQL